MKKEKKSVFKNYDGSKKRFGSHDGLSLKKFIITVDDLLPMINNFTGYIFFVFPEYLI